MRRDGASGKLGLRISLCFRCFFCGLEFTLGREGLMRAAEWKGGFRFLG